MVFPPSGGFTSSSVDVCMFFHGNSADFETAKAEDNSVKSARMAEAVATSGRNVVGLAPFAGGAAAWQDVAAGDFRAMSDGVLQNLTRDLALTSPLKAGAVSLSGHSGGGRALGQAALDTGAEEVTLQDAGYGKFDGKLSVNYNDSWSKLGKWFLTGKTKTLRVITASAKGTGDQNASTRYVVESKTSGFGEKALQAQMDRLVADKTLPEALTLASEKGDNAAPRDGQMKLETKLTATRPDGKVQGTMYLYSIATDHQGARDKTMSAVLRGGGDNFGELALGTYEVTDAKAVVREADDLAKRKKEAGKDVVIPRGDKVPLTEIKKSGKDLFAHVDDHGWTMLTNLRLVSAKP